MQKTNSNDRLRPWTLLVTALVIVTLGLSACGTANLATGVSPTATSPETSQETNVSATPQTATLVEPRGWVEVQPAGGEWSAAQPGQTLIAGDRVRTSTLSSANLVFGDGSRAIVRASAELSIDQLDAPVDAPRTIVLTQWNGESDHEVAHNQRPGSRYAVNTPMGTGEAKGTVFHVAVGSDNRADFAVSEGVVAVSGQDETVLVDAGEVTTVTAEEPPLEPVQSVSAEGLLSQTGEAYVIAGQSYTVSATTVLVGDPQIGDWVYVEGRQATDGTLSADRIVLLAPAAESRFSLSGTIEAQSETAWTVNGQMVTLSAATLIDADLALGESVQVEGVVLPGGELLAESIRRVAEAPGLPFSFTGVVQEIAADRWVVSGLALVITPETTLSDALQTGEAVQAQGWALADGTWQASSITRLEQPTTPFDFTGVLESTDPWQVGGIAFQVGDYTQIDPGLVAGDQVRVTGEVSPEGAWLAATVELVEETPAQTMVIVGPVVSIDPWVINGTTLTPAEGLSVPPEIVVGSQVQATAELQADGTWSMVAIEALETPGEVPPCVQVTAELTSVEAGQIQIEGWPALTLEETTVVSGGELVAGENVQAEICFDAAFQIHVTQITVNPADDPDDPTDPEDPGAGAGEEKVQVCHKPDGKKDGQTLTIAQPALQAHLDHGDTEGACTQISEPDTLNDAQAKPKTISTEQAKPKKNKNK